MNVECTASAVCDTALPVQGDFRIGLLKHHHPWQSRNDAQQQMLHSLNTADLLTSDQ